MLRTSLTEARERRTLTALLAGILASFQLQREGEASSRSCHRLGAFLANNSEDLEEETKPSGHWDETDLRNFT